MKPLICFRADGNTQIGLGHITRSLALADMLRPNFAIRFLVQAPSEQIREQIADITDDLVVLPPTDDYLSEAAYIAAQLLEGHEIMVLDGYNFQTDYQKIIKKACKKLVCIDDLHAWHFVADVVINHAGGVSESDYSREPYTKLCLGLDYALLRRPFLEAARMLAAQGGRKIEKIERALICFGGSDIHNLTLEAAKAAWESKKFEEIHIVTGSAFAHMQDLLNFTQGKISIFLHQNLDAQAMCNLMLHCHLAIVPASGVSMEAFFCQMAICVVQTAQNQKAFLNWLCQQPNIFFSNTSNFRFENIRSYLKTQFCVLML